MQHLPRALYRYSIAVVNSIHIFLYSFTLWPISAWVRFWITRRDTIMVSLDSVTMHIRASSLHAKLVDLHMATTCLTRQQYTPATMTINPADTIIDIGGHIGSFALFAASRAPQGRIFTYEPDPENYRILNKNISLQYANITGFQKAVAAVGGRKTFYRASLNNAENSLFKKGSLSFSVEGTTIQDIFTDNAIKQCDFLKLDCEGAEYEILLTAPSAVLSAIRRIAIECHRKEYFDIENSNYTLEHLVTFLQQQGFVTEVLPENRMHSIILAHRT